MVIPEHRTAKRAQCEKGLPRARIDFMGLSRKQISMKQMRLLLVFFLSTASFFFCVLLRLWDTNELNGHGDGGEGSELRNAEQGTDPWERRNGLFPDLRFDAPKPEIRVSRIDGREMELSLSS
jgi:hypothetical protein